jgi:N-acetyl-gamma-glutamyl-phosphate reductase
MIAEFEAGAAPTAWRTYALSLAHKHVPEMMAHSGLSSAPVFAPSVANTHRGMIVDVPLPLGVMPGKPAPDAIRAAWAQCYAGSAIVRVVDQYTEATLTIEHMAGRDGMELMLFASADGAQARLVAALDNLGKGASGAAVQNLNILCGIEEATGLTL